MMLNDDKEVFMGFMNLHDAFLNASMQRSCMLKAPIENDPEEFHISDRGRFERTWIAFLYVLVEAWRSDNMAEVRFFVGSIAPIDKLESLLKQADQDGSLTKMQAIRHYMCHRDKRQYWNEGRLGVTGQLQFHERLHVAFSEVMLSVFNALGARHSSGG